jgi:membrane protein insertase Oxa1/YidC/SpoIIIJ
VLYLLTKALVSGAIVAAVSEIARRFPGWGGLLASLPLVSVLAMTWLYADTRDTMKVADLAIGTFWFFLPSMPMFLIIPVLLRSGWSWAATIALAIAVTLALYAVMFWIAPRLGLRL